MSELRTTDIEGWLHPSVQGEVIVRGNIPPQDLLDDTHTPVVVAGNAALPRSLVELTQVSPNHRRSYEIGSDSRRQRLARFAIWHDEFANNYTSYSLKGNNFSETAIMQSQTAPSGYIPIGLLESDALLRVIRASRMLRENGVSTEWVSRVFEPGELLFRGEPVTQAEYKARLLDDVANAKGVEEMLRVAPALEPMTFFVTGRSMEVNDRPQDFRRDDPAKARLRLQHVFRVYNKLHADDEDFRPLRHDRLSDRTHFMTNVFPGLLGRNLAKLHNLGLVHQHPVMGNVTLLGGLIDLDSVRGAPLGLDDAPVTPNDRFHDLNTTIEDDTAMNNLYDHLANREMIKSDSYPKAIATLLESYDANLSVEDESLPELEELILVSASKYSSEFTADAYTKLNSSEAQALMGTLRRVVDECATKVYSPAYLARISDYCVDHTLYYYVKKQMNEARARGDKVVEYEIYDDAFDDITRLMQFKLNLDIEWISSQEDALEVAVAGATTLNRHFDQENVEKIIDHLIDHANKNRIAEVAADQARAAAEIELLESAVGKAIEDFFKNLDENDVSTQIDFADHEPDHVIILNQKLVYGYEALETKLLVEQLAKPDYEIVIQHEAPEWQNFDVPNGMQIRSVMTDAPQLSLHRTTQYDNGINFVADIGDEDILDFEPGEYYLAYLGDALKEGGKPIVFIKTNNDVIPEMLRLTGREYTLYSEK